MAVRVQRHLCGLPSSKSPPPSPQHVVQVKTGENDESGQPKEQEKSSPHRDNLRPTEGAVWSQGSDSHIYCPSVGGRKGKQSVLVPMTGKGTPQARALGKSV